MPTELTERQRIAANVRAEMARLGKTQREIADLLGAVQPVISLRLQGKRAWRAEELATIAAAWDIPIGEFYRERAA